jgi:hypothetical protein
MQATYRGQPKNLLISALGTFLARSPFFEKPTRHRSALSAGRAAATRETKCGSLCDFEDVNKNIKKLSRH